MPAQKAKNQKSPDKRPARGRYWASGKLPFRKIRALVRSGYTVEGALKVWEATRVRQRSGATPQMQTNYYTIGKLKRLERTKRPKSTRKPGKGLVGGRKGVAHGGETT